MGPPKKSAGQEKYDAFVAQYLKAYSSVQKELAIKNAQNKWRELKTASDGALDNYLLQLKGKEAALKAKNMSMWGRFVGGSSTSSAQSRTTSPVEISDDKEESGALESTSSIPER